MENQENNFNSDNQPVSGEVNSTPTENPNSAPDNSMNYGMNENPQQNIPENNYGDNQNPYDIPQQEQYIYPEGLTVVDDNKKSPVPFIVIGVVAALVISLVLMFVFVPVLKHSLLRTFMPAEKYYQLVESERIDFIRKLSDASEKNGTGVYADMSYDAKYGVKINPSEEIKEAGLDKIDFIFDSDFTLKSKKLKADTDFILNDGKIFDLSIIQDLEKGDSYVAVPLISDSYVFIDGNIEYDEESENFDVESTCEFFDKLVENINSVEKSPKYKGKLKNLYVYEIKYDDAFRTALTEKIKPQLLEDEKTGNAIDKMGNTYEEFIDSIIEMFEKLDSCKVFVDGNGQIVGRNFVMQDGNELTYLIEAKGRDMYTLIDAKSEDDLNNTIEFNITKGKNGFTGKGTIKDEEKNATADITIKNLDIVNKKDEYAVDGAIDMTVNVEDNEPIIIKMTAKASEKEGKFSIDTTGIQDDIDINMNMFFEYQKKSDSPEEIKIPEKYFTTEQSDEYFETADMDALIKAFTENEFFKVAIGQQNSGFGGNNLPDNDFDNDFDDDFDDDIDDDFDKDSDDDFADTTEQDEENSSDDEKDLVDVEVDMTKTNFTIHGNKVYPGVKIGEVVDIKEADMMVKPGEEASAITDDDESVMGSNKTDKEIPLTECELTGYTTISIDKNLYDLAGIKPGSSRDDLKKYLPEAYSKKADTIVIYGKKFEQMIMLLYDDDKLVAISYTCV